MPFLEIFQSKSDSVSSFLIPSLGHYVNTWALR